MKLKLTTVMPLTLCLLTLFGSRLPAQTLIHRYSFSDTAGGSAFADSVGTANGTLQQGTSANPNSAYLTGTELQLDGTGGYGLMPGGLISSLSQVTIEFWASYSNNLVWTRTFAFGDQTGGGGANSSLDYCHYAGGNYQNLNLMTNGPSPSTYVNNNAGLDGQANVHVTVVVDPVNNQMYYYNGTVLISSPLGGAGIVYPLSGINDVFGTIGRSLYNIDPTLAGSIDEFRIYSGVLSVSGIALNDAAGPNNYVTSPGTAQSLNLSSPSGTLIVSGNMPLTLFGNFSSVSNLNLLLYGGASFTSGNTGVLTVNATNGIVHGVAPGTTTVTATYASVSTNVTITIVAPAAVLAHRYSFASAGDTSDSIGGANGTLMGTATVTGGQLVLDGSSGCYLALPGSQINIATNSAVTFDAWVTFGNATSWAEFFAFGNTNSGNGVNNIACVPCAGGGGFDNWGLTENLPNGRTPGWAHGWHNVTTHITSVLDPATGTMSVYRDGVLEVAEYDATSPISGIATNYAFLGRSLFDADPYLPASIDEFRIYSGALTPTQVALDQLGGSGSTNLNVGALSSIAVIPTNYPAYASLVAPVILANYANLTNFNLLPTTSAGGNITLLSGSQPLVVTSSDPTIVSVNAQNMLTTYRPGTVTLSASYGGKTSSATIKVENQATLTHRYSFTGAGDTSDSVGGANGTLQGAATVSGGQLQLTGNDADYLALPGGLLQNYSAVTVDTWVTFGAAQNWARLWEFADVGSGNQDEFYFAPGWNNPPNGNFYSAGFPWGNSVFTSGVLGSETLHITCEYGDGWLQVYTNSVLEASVSNSVAPASSAGLNSAFIGHSPYNDPGLNGSVDEFRIYKGRLSPGEITASDILGPNQVLATSGVTLRATQSGGNSVISWPLAAAGFSLQTSSNLASGGWVTLTNAPVVVGNTNWQITVPASGGQQFYRLWR